MPISELIGYCDGYKQELAVKNSHTFAMWDTVVITTNYDYPNGIYTGAFAGHRAALFRRTTASRHFNKVWQEMTPPIFEGESDNEQTEEMAEQQSDGIHQHGFIFCD